METALDPKECLQQLQEQQQQIAEGVGDNAKPSGLPVSSFNTDGGGATPPVAPVADGATADAVVVVSEVRATDKEGDEETMLLDEERRKLLTKRSKQLHWGSSLQMFTPVHIWRATYKLTPAALGPGFQATQMVNGKGLVISTYKWTHAKPEDVRGAIVLYHSYTSHALWDFLRHQAVPQQKQHGPGPHQRLNQQGELGKAVCAECGAPPTGESSPQEEAIKEWVPQYAEFALCLAESWVEALYNEGFNVYAADHQSHGHSEGWRGWRCNVQDFFCFVEDSLQFLTEVVARDPCTPASAPIYLLGYSMGGNIALQTLGALFSPTTAATFHSVAAETCSPPPDLSLHAAGNAVLASRSLAGCPTGPAAASGQNGTVSRVAGGTASALLAGDAQAGMPNAPPGEEAAKEATAKQKQQPPNVSQRVKGVVLLAPMIQILMDFKTRLLAKINVHFLSCCLPNLRLVRSAGGPGYEYLDWWYEKDLFAYAVLLALRQLHVFVCCNVAGRSKSRMVANLLRAVQQVKTSIKNLPPQLKVLCLQGTRDMTVDYRGALSLTQSQAQVDLMYLTGWSHYLAKEKGSELLTEFVVTWLRAKLQAESLGTPPEGSCLRGDSGIRTGKPQPPVLLEYYKGNIIQAREQAA